MVPERPALGSRTRSSSTASIVNQEDTTDTARAETGVGAGTEGVVITSLAQSGPAVDAGLMVGDVIVRLGSENTPTPQALKAALQSEKTDPALLLINRSGNQIFVTVEIT